MAMDFSKGYKHLTDKSVHNSKTLFGADGHKKLEQLDSQRSQEKEQAKTGVGGAYEYKSEYRKKADQEYFDMQNLTKTELAKIGKMIVGYTPNEIMEIVHDGEACALHAMMASMVSRIIRTGDVGSFNMLMDRLIGKVETSGKEEELLDVTGSRLEVVVDNTRKIRLPMNGRESAVG